MASTAWISWLRTVAIIAVLTIHTTGSTAAAPDARSSATGLVAIAVDVGSHFAVPVFVMVSGALNLDPYRYRGARDFLRRRTARLVPAVVFWHLWYIGVRALRGDDMDAGDIAHRVFVGELFTQLYFLWIVLGLSLLTPLLMPVVQRLGRRGTGIAGAGFALLVAVGVSLGLETERTENALLWWLPYLGYYVLGWALREVRLRGGLLTLAVVATVGLGALLQWQWANDRVPPVLDAVAPIGYYGASMVLYSIGVFLVAHGLLAPDGVLRRLTRAPALSVGKELGAATLGVFGFHMTVLAVMTATGFLGVDEPADDVATLAARVLVVVVVSFAVVLPLRRVPVVRAVL